MVYRAVFLIKKIVDKNKYIEYIKCINCVNTRME